MAGLVIEFDSSELEKGAIRVKRVVSDATGAVDKFAGSVDKAEDDSEKFAKSIRDIESALDPVTRSTRQYEQTVSKLQDGLRRGVLTQDRYNQLLGKAQTHYSTGTRGATAFSEALGGLSARFLSITAVITAAVGALTAFVRGMQKAVTEAGEAQHVLGQVNAALASTKGVSGQTVESLQSIAKALQRTSTFGDDAILKMQSVLLTFTQIRGDNFEAASKAVLNLSTRLGMDLQSAALQVGKALNDPIEGLSALSRAGIQFSASQEAAIRSMVEAGNMAEAQRIILKELEVQFGGSAAAGRDEFQGAMKAAQNAIGDLFEAVGDGLLPGLQKLVDVFVDLAQRQETIVAFEAIGRAIGFVVEAVAKAVEGFVFLRNTIAEFISGLDPRLQALMFGGGPTKRRVPVLTFDRPEAPKAPGLTDEAMESALRNHVKSLEAAEKAADQYATALGKLAESEKKVADHEKEIADARARLATLPTLDELIGTPDIIPYGPVIEGMSDAEKRAKAWSDEMEAVTDSLSGTSAAAIDAAFSTDAFIDSMSQQHVVEAYRSELKKLEEEFKEFEKQVSENFLRGVQTSLSSFFYDVFSGGEDALKNFGKALKDLLFKTLAEYLAQWAITQAKMLALSLKRIAAEKAATEAAGLGKGKGGQGKGVDAGSLTSLGNSSSLWSGGASSVGVAMIGIAVVAGIAAYFKHQSSKERANKYGTFASYDATTGATWGGKLDQTGPAAMKALSDFFKGLQEVTGSGIVAMERATVLIKNSKEGFRAVVGGEIVGYFKTFEEAMIAAVKKSFLGAELTKALDPAVRQVIEGYKGKDPNELLQTVQFVQQLVDAASGLTDQELAIQRTAAAFDQIRQKLIELGVSASEATRLAGLSTVKSYRDTWRSIAGIQETPAQEKERREREKAFLLSQVKLDRVRAEMERAKLKAEAGFVKVGLGLAQQEIKGRHQILQAQGNLVRAEFGLGSAYLDGRRQLVESEAVLRNAELEAFDLYIAELDKLIAEIEKTPIRVGGSHGRGGGLDNVIGGAGRFGGGGRLITALERLISAVDKLREFQKSLAQDEQLSPYSVTQRFGMAQSQFQSVASAAQQGKVWAIEMLPDVARQYLELASQMYGTAGAGYGGIFEQVNQILQAISDQYPSGTDPQAWMRSGMESVNRYLAAIRGDGNRRSEQHDETNSRLRDSNRKMDDLIDAVERQGAALNRVVSTGATRPGIGGPRQGNGNFRAA